MTTHPLENLVKAAMAAGVACATDKYRLGLVDRAAPLVDVFGDFPAKFIQTRPDLVEGIPTAKQLKKLRAKLKDAESRIAAARTEIEELSSYTQQWTPNSFARLHAALDALGAK